MATVFKNAKIAWFADEIFKYGFKNIVTKLRTTNSSDFRQGVEGLFTGLPTADPHVAGKLWLNVGVVTVSQG